MGWSVYPTDSGWVPLTVNSGYSVVSSYPVEVRRIDKLVSLRGMAGWASGSLEGRAIVTLPADFRPTRNVWLGAIKSSANTTSTGVADILVQPNGYVLIPSTLYWQGTWPASSYIILSGSFLLG